MVTKWINLVKSYRMLAGASVMISKWCTDELNEIYMPKEEILPVISSINLHIIFVSACKTKKITFILSYNAMANV